jgi:multidrug transporter EmrE-like cation transporter
MVSNEKLNSFLLVLTAICLTVSGELFLKSGMNRVGPVLFDRLGETIGRIARTPRVWGGFGFIGAGACFWLAAISRAPLSWAYPILSLGYVMILLFSRIALGEPVSWVRWLGTAVIVGGVYLVFRS